MKAKKLPSGNYRVQVMVDGVRESFTAPSKVEAIYLASQWQQERKEKRNPANLTVGDAVKMYIDSRENLLSPATIHEYRSMNRRYFSSMEPLKLSRLTSFTVQSYINDWARQGLSPKSIRNIYGLLRSACKVDFEITLPSAVKIEYRTPDAEGIKNILKQTAGTPIEVPVLLALVCGMRMSEIRGLKWGKVTPAEIIVDNAIVDVGTEAVEKKPKTKESVRRIAIAPWLYDRIMEEPKNSEYVTNLSSRAIYARFRKLTDNACRFHDLRHANASVMMLLGIPDSYAMERGGWETESIYKKTYVQNHDEGRKAFADTINDYFRNLLPEEEK